MHVRGRRGSACGPLFLIKENYSYRNFPTYKQRQKLVAIQCDAYHLEVNRGIYSMVFTRQLLNLPLIFKCMSELSL